MPRRGLAGLPDQAVTAPGRDQTRRTIPVIMTGRKGFGVSDLRSQEGSQTG
jgi:hypothetical protein